MNKKIIFYSSIGAALYPRITEKDMEGKFASKKYSTQLVYQSPEDLAKDKARLQAIADNMKWEQGIPKLPFKTSKNGEETLIAKSAYLPMVIDSSKNVLIDKWHPPGPEALAALKIPSGSIIRISAIVFPYDTKSLGAGLSLQMDTVQLIKKSEGSLEGFDEENGEAFEAAQSRGFDASDRDDDIPF